MREQIIAGIRDADNEFAWNLRADQVEVMANRILDRLQTVPAGTPAPAVEILPAAAPVLSIDATEIVAMLATTAGRHSPDERVTDYDWSADPADYKQFRQFLFAVQDLFGVRVRVRAGLAPDGVTFTAGYLVAGRAGDRDAFRLVMQTFHDLGAPIAAGMTPDRQTEFWATLGGLVATSSRAQAAREAAAYRFADATDYLRRVYGPARVLPRTDPAENGDPLYAAAVSVVADAATRL